MWAKRMWLFFVGEQKGRPFPFLTGRWRGLKPHCAPGEWTGFDGGKPLTGMARLPLDHWGGNKLPSCPSPCYSSLACASTHARGQQEHPFPVFFRPCALCSNSFDSSPWSHLFSPWKKESFLMKVFGTVALSGNEKVKGSECNQVITQEERKTATPFPPLTACRPGVWRKA